MSYIIVRNAETKLFYKEDSWWTDNPAEAKHFESAVEAVQFCESDDGGPYEVVLKAQAPRCDVVAFQYPPKKAV